MRSCTPALRSMLLAFKPITTLVGQRVYFVQAQQGADLPQIVLKDITATLVGTLTETRGPVARRITVECRADTYAAAEDIGEYVLQALEPFRGWSQGFMFHGIIPVSDVPLFEDTSAVWSRAIDFRVHYS